MKVLIIIGDCIQVNSSANLCHLAYIRGLVEAGYELSLLSADGDGYAKDEAMMIPPSVKRYSYPGIGLYERLSIIKKKISASPESASSGSQELNADNQMRFLSKMKDWLRSLYGAHEIYAVFRRKARRFRSPETYDFLISISSPASSHALALDLISSGHVKCKNWIQIWEDPWYSDLYLKKRRAVFAEERRLLSAAEHICYVSPITLEYQKRLFPEASHKMFWQPLPAYYTMEKPTQKSSDNYHFGYFGDYSPKIRNLRPFYEAACKTGIPVSVCGDPSSLFQPTDHITIFPRLPLNKLHPIEETTDVLVYLCNREGGQIPGKIYQYAATNKTVLFILDGTEEEKRILREFFEPYHRFVFCENDIEGIEAAVEQIQKGELGDVVNRSLTDFEPVKIINRILEEGMK